MAIVSDAAHRVRHSFYGWRIVMLMLGPRAAGVGVFILGGTLFVIPLEEDLGIQRGVSSLLFAAAALVSGVTAPISGALMDKHGPRLVLLGSVAVAAGGYALLALATNVALVFLFYVAVISPVILNIAFNASSAFVNNWFDRNKAIAMSLLQVGSGLGAVIIIPTLAFVIDAAGWRWAALTAGGFLIVLSLPAALLSRNAPEEMGLRPDGATPQPRDHPTPAMAGLSAHEALRTPTFWLIAAAVLTFGGAQGGLQIHFVPVMVWKGLDEVEGALVLTVTALMSAPLVLFTGWLADRMGRLMVAGLISFVVASGVLLLNLATNNWTVWTAALVMAPNFGMYPLIWAALGQSFGRRAFSTIRGWVMALQIAGTMGTPILAGLLFEWSGSYTSSLWIIVALWVVAGVLLVLTPRRTYASRPAARAAAAS